MVAIGRQWVAGALVASTTFLAASLVVALVNLDHAMTVLAAPVQLVVLLGALGVAGLAGGGRRA